MTAQGRVIYPDRRAQMLRGRRITKADRIRAAILVARRKRDAMMILLNQDLKKATAAMDAFGKAMKSLPPQEPPA